MEESLSNTRIENENKGNKFKGENDMPTDIGIGSSTTLVDPAKEAKMMRKFDLFAIGLFGLFYMMANLDRSNLGNAQVAGMPEDIGLVGNQFGTATTLL